nr:MAG TPA: hypothetical protein [Caudoviricetes sp.]
MIQNCNNCIISFAASVPLYHRRIMNTILFT